MSENELKRVLSNPENLIISDSLKGRIDFGEETSSSAPKNLYDLVFSVEGQSFTGRLIEFRRTLKSFHICFNSQESFLDKFLNIRPESEFEATISSVKFSGKLETFEFSIVESELQVKVSVLEHN